MKFSRFGLISLSVLSVLSLCALGSLAHSAFNESATELNAKGVRFQASDSSDGKIEVSETFVQTGTFVDASSVEHYYLRFATAVNLDSESGIQSLEYIRRVGQDEKITSVNTVYKKVSAESSNYYSYDGERLVEGETTNEWYFACYTIEVKSEEYRAKDFSLSLRVNEEVVYAYTSASLEALRGEYHVVRFENEGNLLGKQIVVRNETPTYLGEEVTKEADDHTYTFGWDKELAPVTEDTTYSVEFKKNHHYGEATRNEATSTETEPIYETKACTVSGCGEVSKTEVGHVFQSDHAQRRSSRHDVKLYDANGIPEANNTIRINKNQHIEYTIYSRKNADATLSFQMVSRDAYKDTDFSIFDLYTLTLNGETLQPSEETTTLPPSWGTGYGNKGIVVAGTIHLNEGYNYLKIKSTATNKANFDFVKLDYKSDTVTFLPNLNRINAVDAQTIYMTDSSHNDIYRDSTENTNNQRAYLSEYTSGANVRLTNKDYLEYKFVSSKDADIELYADIEFRSQFGTTVTEQVDGEIVEKFIPYKSMSEVLTVSTKEAENEYTSCELSDEKVLYSTKSGCEFHYLKICDLTLKAGVTYSLKIQVELNLHFEEFFFLNSENAIISLI